MLRASAFARRGLALFLFTAVLPLTPALAVDGVFEINQACVATGCFPGDSPGFPIELGRGSYRLTSDIETPDTDATAIVVRANRGMTTIDLGGFALSGRYVCSVSPPNCPTGAGNAIVSEEASRVVVKNGFIRNFSAIALDLISGVSIVENVMIENIGDEGILARSGSTLRNNILTGIGDNGIRMNLGNLGGLIEGNVVNSTGGDAIETGASLVLRNHIMDAGDVCIRIAAGAGYGENRVDCDTISGGVSFGTNACNGAAC